MSGHVVPTAASPPPPQQQHAKSASGCEPARLEACSVVKRGDRRMSSIINYDYYVDLPSPLYPIISCYIYSHSTQIAIPRTTGAIAKATGTLPTMSYPKPRVAHQHTPASVVSHSPPLL